MNESHEHDIKYLNSKIVGLELAVEWAIQWIEHHKIEPDPAWVTKENLLKMLRNNLGEDVESPN